MTDYETVKKNVADQMSQVSYQFERASTLQEENTATLLNDIGLAINREGGMSI